MLTVAVVAFALVAQLVLVATGASVLVETAEPPGLATRLLRFVSYFTVQSNALVLATTWLLVRTPSYDGRLWRIARADAVAGIAITGVVHWFFLRPLLDLQGWAYVTDKLLHVVVPLLAVAGWLMFGPRRRIGWPTLLPALVWPTAWLLYTLVMGAITSWYPYPFLDVTQHGYGSVLLASFGVAIALVAVLSFLVVLDRPLRAAEDHDS
jgi:uncharacterized membrane protein